MLACTSSKICSFNFNLKFKVLRKIMNVQFAISISISIINFNFNFNYKFYIHLIRLNLDFFYKMHTKTFTIQIKFLFLWLMPENFIGIFIEGNYVLKYLWIKLLIICTVKSISGVFTRISAYICNTADILNIITAYILNIVYSSRRIT